MNGQTNKQMPSFLEACPAMQESPKNKKEISSINTHNSLHEPAIQLLQLNYAKNKQINYKSNYSRKI